MLRVPRRPRSCLRLREAALRVSIPLRFTQDDTGGYQTHIKKGSRQNETPFSLFTLIPGLTDRNFHGELIVWREDDILPLANFFVLSKNKPCLAWKTPAP